MGANFTRADLSGAIVGRADPGAILTDARLAAAPLHASTTRTLVIGVGATLSGSDLTRATLTGADLTGADVTGVRLTRRGPHWRTLATRCGCSGRLATRCRLGWLEAG